ncbi:hypothetical protein KUTeg_018853 [Tegillarca granosa]|uniref:PQ-loop repeat-containing protein 1 n=1 Tax=Tegillarca granosa TaxID=220873 RepID=A0ABQ9EFV8_TEGGR|nr:hypothetical protein KUTeg_018853 [Tegillarca granosa]
MSTQMPMTYLHGFITSYHLPITMPQEITVTKLISWFSAGAMIFGGVFPFIPQYRDIKRSGNTEGFSTFVCLTLLIANILRIMFWFVKLFILSLMDLPLLAQSYIMVFTMLAMVHLCVVTKRKSEILAQKQRKFSDFDMKYFWKWTDFRSYLEFSALFTAVVGFWTYIFLYNMIYVEIIGFLAVFAEAMLGAPQFYRNFQNKSTQGMSRLQILYQDNQN